LADAEKDVALKKKYGLSTPKNVTQWSNRLLHKAMGIPTEESPGTVLSKVSTAPPSARTTASDAEGVDPPDDSEEEEEFSEVNATSGLLNAKSSDRTPAMENSMEEMVGTYDDEYDEGGGGGFELNTQGEVGFDNDYDHFEEEVSGVDTCGVCETDVAALLLVFIPISIVHCCSHRSQYQPQARR